jgi:hypothetical protein
MGRGRFKAELRCRGFNGRPLRVLHGMRKRERRHDDHDAAARGRGSARPAQRRRKGGRGKGAHDLVGRLDLLGQIGPLSGGKKKENRNLF